MGFIGGAKKIWKQTLYRNRRQVKWRQTSATLATASDFTWHLPQRWVLWCYNISQGCRHYTVKDSHCWGLTEIMGLEASVSKLPPQQLLKAAAHPHHRGAQWALDSFMSLGGNRVIKVLLSNFPEMFHLYTIKSSADVSLAPWCQACNRGFNKPNFLTCFSTNSDNGKVLEERDVALVWDVR